MPRRFFLVRTAAFVALIASALLFEPIGYWNLTAFELIAFSIIFGWISVFIRFVDAIANPEPVAESGEVDSEQQRPRGPAEQGSLI